MIVDNVTHDCRTCKNAEFINRFKVHCCQLESVITRPRKCAYYAMSEQAQAFNKATRGAKP